MTTIAVLQISDIHFKTTNDRALARPKAIATVFNGSPPVDATIIAVTGDIAFGGKKSEYDLAKKFIGELRAQLQAIPAAGTVHVVMIPGNHDNDYGVDNGARKMIVQQLLATPAAGRDEAVIKLCTDIQAAYFEFMADIEGSAPQVTNRVFWQRAIMVAGKKLQFNCYNSAWHETADAGKRTLTFPVGSAIAADSASDVTIALIHHPLQWFAIENYRQLEAHLEESADVVMTGHEHRAGQYERTTAVDQGTQHYESGALQPHGGMAASEFNIVFLDLEGRRHKHIGYEWSDGRYERRGDSSDWRPYLRNEHLRAGFHIRTQFRDRFLDDAGAQFTHPARTRLYLSDIYVPPQLKEVRAWSSKPVEIVSARDCLEIAKAEGRALVYGATWVGKTAYCKWLMRSLHHDDTVAVYLTGGAFVSSVADNVTALTEQAFVQQYGAAKLEAFRQLPRSSRALVIDEYEEMRIPKAQRDGLFKQLESYFGTVIVVADELARVDEISYGKSAANPLVRYRRFDLQPLGHVLRNHLARKWHELSLGDITDDAVEKRIEQTEAVLRAVIATNTVPPLPIFLLVFLQSEEAMRKNESAAPELSGSFGFLHQELIKKSLVSASGPADWDTTHKYLAELAYSMFVADQRAVGVGDLDKHHRGYSQTFHLSLDGQQMVSYLVDAGILRDDAGTYSFKYPYLFPFFFAYAVKDSPERFSSHIEPLVDAVHKTEHAHIIMFLSYFMRDDRVVSHVLAKARSLYADVQPCDMEVHVEFLNALQVEEVELVLPESTPEENHDAVRHELDRRESQNAPAALAAREERAEEVNEVLQINVAMKTIEILGQVLRNFPGSTVGERKKEIADECYKLSLRTMRRLLDLLNENVTKIVEDFARALEDQRGIPYHSAHEKAKYGVYALAEMLSFGLIWKTADSLGLQKLAWTFDALVDGAPSVGTALIDVAVRLDHFSAFPEPKVDALIKRTKPMPFARAVLKRLVHRHFYLFKRPEQLRQSVCSRLEIKVVKPAVAFPITHTGKP